MRLSALFALFTLAGCNELASPKDLDTDPLEYKMRPTEPGETSITVRGKALGDGGGIEVVTQDYGEAEVVTPYGSDGTAHLVTLAAEDYDAVCGIFYAVRDEGEGWEVSTEAAPVGYPVEQISGLENGQGWHVIAPLGVSVSVADW